LEVKDQYLEFVYKETLEKTEGVINH